MSRNRIGPEPRGTEARPVRRGAHRVPPTLALALLLASFLIVVGAAIGIWYAATSDMERTGASWRRELPPAATASLAIDPVLPAPPAVEPVEYVLVPEDEARRINGLVPLVTGPIPAAPPFRLPVGGLEREKAATCLAAAAYYEAGDDATGQAAVIQVVLNRVLHPAFPANVCGVVFQGAQRQTGCQFSFTCDGSMARRRPQLAAWKRARAAADFALGGGVFRGVGTATHYHTDWVVPKWGAELDKIAIVHTHLFFRFKGPWGSPQALRTAYAGPEPIDPRIAMLAGAGVESQPWGAGVTGAGATAGNGIGPLPAPVPALATADLGGNLVRLADLTTNLFLLQLDPAAYPGSYAVAAWKLCHDRSPCRVAGWRSAGDVPQRLPLTGDWRAKMTFWFEKDGVSGQRSQWDCRIIPRDNRQQCLPGTEARAPAATP